MNDAAVSIREFDPDSDFEGMFAITREIVGAPAAGPRAADFRPPTRCRRSAVV